MRRLRLLAATAVVATAAGLAVPATAATTRTVTVEDLAFAPETQRVRKGDTVVWRFRDGGIPHDVTGKGLRSRRGQTGGTYRRTFRTRGTFRYVCTLHPGMDGRVVVR